MASQGSIAILMFHEGVTVPAAKLNMSWTSDGVVAEDGTLKYTGKKNKNYKKFKNIKTKRTTFKYFDLLCCPALSPQMVGTTVDAPPT